jgi:hypothetical protein
MVVLKDELPSLFFSSLFGMCKKKVVVIQHRKNGGRAII